MEAIVELPEKSVAADKFSLFQSWRYAKSKFISTGAIQAADIARERYEFRLMRLARDKQERAQRRAQKTADAIAGSEARTGQQEKAEENKKAAIAAAIERAKTQQTILKSHHQSKPPAPLS
jgi:Na+-translocating ferredoxin:NAD+ oxidoreductase RnfC subunit